MTNKVYWKGLRISADLTRRYIQRNQTQLEANLTAPQYTCVLNLLSALLECLLTLPPNTPE